MKKLLFILFLPVLIYAQDSSSVSLDKAFLNAKKGIFWSLSNIPYSKNTITKDLIDEEKLIATVKLNKEIGGVKIISTGYSGSFEVETRLYKSYKKLIEEDYIKEIPKVKF